MNTKKLFEAKNLTVYKGLLRTFGDYKSNVPCTGVDKLFDILVKNGASIMPRDKLALGILSYILGSEKNTPAAVHALLNTRFAGLPVEFKPVIKTGRKYEVAMWTRGKIIYDRVKDLIDWEDTKQVGGWTDIDGNKLEIIDIQNNTVEKK